MKTLKCLGMLAIFMLSMVSVYAQEPEADPVITLERTACFGACPIYTVSIFEDGTVVYNGERFVEVTGEQTTEIAPETVASMIEAFEAAGYFDWDEAYDKITITDQPSAITSVTRGGETHRITHNAGDRSAPLLLTYLEQWIDEMAHTPMWTGVQLDFAALSNEGELPVLTLKRLQCFGFCPEYNAALFADGTVVYMGLANVDKLGVYVFQTDDWAVSGIVDQAAYSGYFDWKDSYEDITMTDQATVISSVRSGDQFKRIVRYDGDPNAPIGLVRIEDRIDRLVAELAG